MESVVGNITQHAGMADDINPKLNELLKRLYATLIFESIWCLDGAKHRTKLRVSVYRKSGGNAQTSVSVTYPNHGNAEINFLEICSCFRHVS